MKIIYDGFALMPKLCCVCGQRFIFEKYVSFEPLISPSVYGKNYICKSCYEKNKKEIK